MAATEVGRTNRVDVDIARNEEDGFVVVHVGSREMRRHCGEDVRSGEAVVESGGAARMMKTKLKEARRGGKSHSVRQRRSDTAKGPATHSYDSPPSPCAISTLPAFLVASTSDLIVLIHFEGLCERA
jgi:hypothetical protein